MVVITIQNQVNQNHTPTGLSFTREDQLSGEVIRSVLDMFSESDARFNVLDNLVVYIHNVKMPVGFGFGIKTKGRPLFVMAQLKKNIVEVKAEENCLARALM